MKEQAGEYREIVNDIFRLVQVVSEGDDFKVYTSEQLIFLDIQN